MHRFLGLRADWRRTSVLGAVAAILVGGVFAISAFAVHDTGSFELDGNATNGAAPGDDWDNVCHQVVGSDCSTSSDTSGATAVDWVAELNLNATIFTGGGSKDPQDINQWAWKDGAGGLPDKDNLLHSFAARYNTTQGDVLYFGSDRLDNSGDAQQGFWFFQNEIALGSNSVGGGTGFTGVHKAGDLLVVTDFSNGGTTSTITVYEWDPTCTKTTGSTVGTCGDANLRIRATSANANCSSAAANDSFCGIVNPANNTTAPWPYTDKSGNSSYLQGEFFEGGINLTAIGASDRCFASVGSESRASTSTTATLKDFILGKFGECKATMKTQVSATSVKPAEPVHDTVTVTGDRPLTPTGDVEFFLCSFAAGSTVACDGTTGRVGVSLGKVALSGIGATATADSPNVNTSGTPLSPGRYCFRAEWPGDTNYKTPLVEFGGETGTNECFTVVNSPTSTATEPRLASNGTAITGPVPVNTQVVDHALITGAAGFGTPTGTVDFFICNPSQVTGAAGSEVCASGGTALSGNPVTATAVAGSDPPQSEATSTPSVVADAVGVWCFRAEYTPNTLNYTGSSDATHSECFTVRDSSSVTTAQDWLPNDTAVVASTGGTALSGTLTFELHESNDCSGAAVTGQTYTRTLTNASTLADRTKSTSNTTYKVTADKTVSWKVTFESSNQFVDSPATSTCEITSLDLTQ